MVSIYKSIIREVILWVPFGLSRAHRAAMKCSTKLQWRQRKSKTREMPWALPSEAREAQRYT